MGFSLCIVPLGKFYILEGYGEAMRIIAGKAKGLRLKVPGHKNVRPTSDRVKEGLFNILQDRISGALFLDGYAGSGSIGLEALSRDAAYVYFVEKHLPTARLLKENLALAKFSDAASVICQDLHKATVSSLSSLKFDLIYLDPPFYYTDEEMWPPTIVDLLKDKGTIILERSNLDQINFIPAGLEIRLVRVYGNIQLIFLQKEAES